MSSSTTLEPHNDLSPTPQRTGRGDAVRWDSKAWALLMVLGGALLLDGLDVSMVGVALPSVQSALGMSTSSLQWIVSGYVLGYGGLLLLGGRMADLLGRRQVFLVGVAVFGIASILGGFVDDGTLLVATRFVKGIAAAFTAPAGLSIIATTFPEGPQRNRAFSIYTIFGASGFSMGLIAGGLLTELGWRWTFVFPGPVAFIVLLAALKFVPKQHRADEGGKYDLLGAATLTATMLLLVYTVVTAPDVGWGSARTLLSFVGVVVLGALFVTIETRVAHPLIRLGILRNRMVLGANLVALLFFGAYAGFQFVAALYIQNLLGWSPIGMALALLPAGLLVVSISPFSDKLVDRFGAPRVLIAGLLSFLPGYLWFLQIGAESQYLLVMLPAVLLIGLGFAFGFPGLMVSATSGVDDDEQGLASGLVQTSFQVGGAVILAVVAAVVTAGGEPTSATETLARFHPALTVVAGISAAAVLVALFAFRGRLTTTTSE